MKSNVNVYKYVTFIVQVLKVNACPQEEGAGLQVLTSDVS